MYFWSDHESSDDKSPKEYLPDSGDKEESEIEYF